MQKLTPTRAHLRNLVSCIGFLSNRIPIDVTMSVHTCQGTPTRVHFQPPELLPLAARVRQAALLGAAAEAERRPLGPKSCFLYGLELPLSFK